MKKHSLLLALAIVSSLQLQGGCNSSKQADSTCFLIEPSDEDEPTTDDTYFLNDLNEPQKQLNRLRNSSHKYHQWIIPSSQQQPFDTKIFLKHQGSQKKDVKFRDKKEAEFEKAMHEAFSRYNNNGSKCFFFPSTSQPNVYIHQDSEDESVYICQLTQEGTSITPDIYEFIKSNFSQTPKVSSEKYILRLTANKSFTVVYNTRENKITDCTGCIEVFDHKTNEHKVLELTEHSQRVFTPEK